MPGAQNSVLINKQLQKLGFGNLKDPSLFDQMAMVIRDHTHFRRLLMSVEEGQRHIAYEALASKLRFTAKPLEDYVIESRTLAEQNQLPHYDPKTLAVTAWKPQEIETQEHKLARVAERAIDEDLRLSEATQIWTLVCAKCTFEQQFRVKRRSNGPRVARRDGWTFPELDKAICRACSKQGEN